MKWYDKALNKVGLMRRSQQSLTYYHITRKPGGPTTVDFHFKNGIRVSGELAGVSGIEYRENSLFEEKSS